MYYLQAVQQAAIVHFRGQKIKSRLLRLFLFGPEITEHVCHSRGCCFANQAWVDALFGTKFADGKQLLDQVLQVGAQHGNGILDYIYKNLAQ